MSLSEFSDRAASARLRLQMAEAVERVHALAWAIVRLEGRAEGGEAERAARDAILETLTPDNNVVSFNRPESRPSDVRAVEPNASAQELLLTILKENEASVRELQTALDDCGLTITPGNLSVILSRMNQAGLIQRTGRGLYRYTR